MEEAAMGWGVGGYGVGGFMGLGGLYRVGGPYRVEGPYRVGGVSMGYDLWGSHIPHHPTDREPHRG